MTAAMKAGGNKERPDAREKEPADFQAMGMLRCDVCGDHLGPSPRGFRGSTSRLECFFPHPSPAESIARCPSEQFL
jgi:hypothetical protein